MENSLPRVSIGLPVYNGELHLAEALATLLNQSYRDFELLISDNASTDNTQKICEAFAKEDARVIYTRQEKNIGALANFNWVLNKARGEYFMWAAHDDVWEADFLSRLVNILDQQPRVELCFTLLSRIEADGEKGQRIYDMSSLCSPDRATRLLRYVKQPAADGKANLIYGLMRRDTLLGIGGFKPLSDFGWGADLLTVFKLFSLGELAIVNELLFFKRSPEDANQSQEKDDQRTRLERRIKEAGIQIDYWHGYQCLLSSIERLPLLTMLSIRRYIAGKKTSYYFRRCKDKLRLLFA